MKILCLSIMLSLAGLATAQNFTLPLWPNGVPNAKSTETKEQSDSSNIVRISHVQIPSIDVFLPSKRNATGQAVVICPGGGYAILAYDWEGTDVARHLAGHGIAAIVLKYRLPDDDSNVEPHKSPLMDTQEAIKIVRDNAEKWSLDMNKIGVMGFSAGGHLASTLGTHFDEASKPNFMALIYPVISMNEEITHMGSRKNLLGENSAQSLVDYYSNELQVTKQTPPTFLLHASDDGAVPVANSLVFYEALIRNNVPAEMHIYPTGGHGFGLGLEQKHLSTWSVRLIEWLQDLNK
ncbi:MAG: esterase [Flammeovirgaceae bacterium]|nr:esterase [Flammeovirgaceae bacterium]MBE63418.1 esterase [Flammeovirgaceae bacterium]